MELYQFGKHLLAITDDYNAMVKLRDAWHNTCTSSDGPTEQMQEAGQAFYNGINQLAHTLQAAIDDYQQALLSAAK